MSQVFPGSIYIFLLDWNVVAVGRFDCNCVCVLPVEIGDAAVVESVVNGVIPTFWKFKTAARGP